MKIALNPFRYRYHFFRSLLVQPFFWCFFFLSPILNIFRVDMIHQKLVFLGQHYPFVFKHLMWLPIVFYSGVVIIGIVSFIWGRLFCGWVCPHNTLSEWTRPFRAVFNRDRNPNWLLRLFQKSPSLQQTFKWLSFPLAVIISYVFSILLAAYIVPFDWISSQYSSGHPHVSLIFGNVLFTIMGIFFTYTGHDFCRNACPYGMCQSMSAYQEGKWRPMEIHFTGQPFTVAEKTVSESEPELVSDSCNTCTACQQVCPVDIDPRHTEELRVGQYWGCFNCGECIDACKTVHQKQDFAGLLHFGYFKKLHDTKAKA